VSFHTTSGDFRAESRRSREAGDLVSGGAAIARGGTKTFLDNGKAVCDLLMSGILPRFPNLHFASVESGMGWAPFVLEALDKRFIKNGVSKSHPEFGDMLPSDYFRRQVSINFWFEELKPYHLDTVGLEPLLWESDFPHAQGNLEEGVAENIDEILAGWNDDVRNTILWDNPARLYAIALDKQGIDHPEVVRYQADPNPAISAEGGSGSDWRKHRGGMSAEGL
jgi:predicted TIM-barrel fold metal-dependent hydrolase